MSASQTGRLRRGEHYAGDLRRDLLDAALELIAAGGPEAVTVRAVAARVGVSHAAPARWYPSRAHLLTAAATEAFQLLHARIAADLEAAPSPRPLHTAARSYLAFAQDLPGHFGVMWRDDLLLDDPALLQAGLASLEQYLLGVQSAREAGWAADRDPEAVADLAWSAAHGLAALRLSGPYQDLSREDFDARADAALDLLEQALS